MNKNNDAYSIITVIIAIALFIFLWPLIKWLAVILLAAALIFGIYVYFSSRKVKKEIEADPQAYFNQSVRTPREKVPADVIDAEYTEKVIDSE